MEVEIAEEKMKGMEHSEQHYFKRSVLFAFPPTAVALPRRSMKLTGFACSYDHHGTIE